MNGLLNAAYPVFSTVDGWLAILPVWLRLVLWGMVSGAAAMGLYAAMSGQGRLQALRARTAELRAAVARTDDAGEAARLAIQNLKVSFRYLGAVTGPALLSGIPVLFVLAWISATFSYVEPAPGTAVALAVAPPGVAVTAVPPAGEAAVAWPEPGGKVALHDGSGMAFEAAAADIATVAIVHKRRWWSWILGNEAGYLPDAAAADAVSFALPPREILGFGPGWMRGWEFIYFISLLIVSLAIKFGFRIA